MLDEAALDRIFRTARTANEFIDRQVEPRLLEQAYQLAVLGPTSANCQPARFIFLQTKSAKERLVPALAPGNLAKTRSAPVTVIVAHDTQFQELLPKVFPHAPQMRSMFDGEEKRALRESTAFRNGSLQGAYFIVAARALGLDCGPMSGFDAAKVDAEFFPAGRLRTNFLLNLGYADHGRTMARSPRLGFDEACQVL